jgi:predicted dienelactone hydrolase
MNRRFLLLFSVLLVAACGSAPKGQPEAAVRMTAGYVADATKAVGVIPEASLHDGRRNKELPISIDYPIYGGPYPVIIFSHGYGGSRSAYEPLASYWTSCGYVVIRPSHADANAIREAFESARFDANTTPAGGERGRRGARGERPVAAAAAAAIRNIEDIWQNQREAQWRDRAEDISLVIDSLADLEVRFPELRGKMDRTKIGVGGHSYGAFTTMLVAGTKTFSNPPLALVDRRVKAAIAMSPQGVSALRGLTTESWRDVSIPLLYMTGSQDNGLTKEEDPAWRRTAFANTAPGDKYFVEIQGANHLSFTGRLGTFERGARMGDSTNDTMGYPRGNYADTSAARRPEVAFGGGRATLRIIRDTSLAFWDAFLKGDTKGKEFLQTKLASDQVKVESK